MKLKVRAEAVLLSGDIVHRLERLLARLVAGRRYQPVFSHVARCWSVLANGILWGRNKHTHRLKNVYATKTKHQIINARPRPHAQVPVRAPSDTQPMCALYLYVHYNLWITRISPEIT